MSTSFRDAEYIDLMIELSTEVTRFNSATAVRE
jgi:hypothetical protein